jgi:undecaprenyl-diphosphatase
MPFLDGHELKMESVYAARSRKRSSILTRGHGGHGGTERRVRRVFSAKAAPHTVDSRIESAVDRIVPSAAIDYKVRMPQKNALPPHWRLVRVLRQVGYEWPFLIWLPAIIGLIWIFLSLAGFLAGEEPHRIDEWLILALRDPHSPGQPWGPRWVQELARDITALGSVGILSFITFIVAGYLWLLGKYRIMALVVAAFLGGTLLSFSLKSGFDRPRPELVPHAVYVQTPSFPSAHSMMAAATYLTLGALLARIQTRRRTRIYILGVAAWTTFIVGVSRIYMGVHWPSDVLGGWILGAAWALACWMIARRMQMRGRLERR